MPVCLMTRSLRSSAWENLFAFALIGPRWETITDADGRPRLFNKGDVVRMELLAGYGAGAFARFPSCLIETVPKASDLPSVLRSVIQRNEFTIRRDRWHRDVEELLKRLGISGRQTTADVTDGPAVDRLVWCQLRWNRWHSQPRTPLPSRNRQGDGMLRRLELA